MEQPKDEVAKKYTEVEHRLSKKDYIGNILYFPFDVEQDYFYTIDNVQRAHVLDQLNSEFDVQEKLSISKRTQTLHVRFANDEDPIPVCVFARWSKGCDPKYLSTLCAEFNADFNGLSFEERDRLYRELCLTHSEKVVEGFDIKFCNKPGGEWIIRCNRNPISSTKKELAKPYPQSTTEAESETEGAGRPPGMDTCELLVPDVSIRTASASSSVVQISQDDPAIVAATVSKDPLGIEEQAEKQHEPAEAPVERAKKSAEPVEEEHVQASTSAEPADQPQQPEGTKEMDVDPLYEDVGSPNAPAGQKIADQPLPGTSLDSHGEKTTSFSNPPAASTPARSKASSSSSGKTSSESTMMSGSEFVDMLNATKQQREEMEKKREEAAMKSPLRKAAKDLEDAQKSQYLSDFQKIMATGVCQIINAQDALMGTISGLLEKEKLRQDLDDALQRDLSKINSNINKRERSIAKIKELTKDIYYEVSQPTRKKIKESVANISAGPSDTSLTKAAAKETNRQAKLDSLKKILKIEVINDASVRLLKSKAYQSYMAEKILFRVASSTSENVAATFNKVFLSVQFSKRFIAYLYWGDDNRASNVNWHSVPLPAPSIQLWNTIAQELCNHDKKLVKRLKQTRKQYLNDAKKERNEAMRLTALDPHDAEKNVYDDYEDFYYLNKDWKKQTRPNDKPPGAEIHKATVMKQKGVKKQYAFAEDSVAPEAEVLLPNAGETCTEEMADEAISSLMSIGYGLGQSPKQMSAEHTKDIHPLLEEQAEEFKVTKRGTKKKHGSKKKDDSDDESDVSDTSLESQKSGEKQSLKRKSKGKHDDPAPKKSKPAKKDQDRSKHKSSSKSRKTSRKEGSTKPKKKKKKKHHDPSPSKKHRDEHTPSKKHKHAPKETPPMQQSQEESSSRRTSEEPETPQKRKASSKFHGFGKESPAKKSRAEERSPKLPLFAIDPSEKITKKQEKRVVISDAPPRVIPTSPAKSSSESTSEESNVEEQTASQRLIATKTISDTSETSYHASKEKQPSDEDSSDSYVSGSTDSSSSDSSSDDEVKVVV